MITVKEFLLPRPTAIARSSVTNYTLVTLSLHALSSFFPVLSPLSYATQTAGVTITNLLYISTTPTNKQILILLWFLLLFDPYEIAIGSVLDFHPQLGHDIITNRVT